MSKISFYFPFVSLDAMLMPHKLRLSSWMGKVGISLVHNYAGIDGECLMNSFGLWRMEIFGTHTKIGCQGWSRLAKGVNGNHQFSTEADSSQW